MHLHDMLVCVEDLECQHGGGGRPTLYCLGYCLGHIRDETQNRACCALYGMNAAWCLRSTAVASGSIILPAHHSAGT